jgi:hypothetical protein
MGALALTVLQLIEQYGPEAVTGIQSLVATLESGGTLTIADVESAFAPLKPYAGYNIRLVKATPPATPAPAAKAA